jgi:hypothetical protein
MRMCSVSGLEAALCIINFIEALVFGLFVVIMFVDQIAAIWDTNHNLDYGDVDLLKPRKPIGKYTALKHVFGEPLSWRWFFPLPQTDQVLKEFAQEIDEDERSAMLPHAAHSSLSSTTNTATNNLMEPSSIQMTPLHTSSVLPPASQSSVAATKAA